MPRTTQWEAFRYHLIEFVVGKMAQKIEVPVAKPDNSSSIPKTHMMEGENSLAKLS